MSRNEIEKYAGGMSAIGTAQGLLGRLERPSQKEMLAEKKKSLEAELSRVNAALTALEEHPEIELVMTLVSQALY